MRSLFWRFYITALLVLATMLMAPVLVAGQLTVTWSHPTHYMDGRPITEETPVHTRVVWKPCTEIVGLDWTDGQFAEVPYPATTYTIPNLADGQQYCVRLRSVMVNPFRQSEPSPQAERSAVVPVPQPPQNNTPNPPGDMVLTVAVVAGMQETPVFKLTSTGKRSPEAAGFVPVGELCHGPVRFRYREQSYRTVNVAAVKWWGVVPGNSVAAPCS